MGEAKRRKAIEDKYGMGKLPESARPFVMAMQEIVELQSRLSDSEKSARNDHQLFFDGVLNNESGVYGIGFPVELFDLDEYAFNASIYALAGFMGVTRFGTAIHSPKNLERGSIIMMLACVKGAWFYSMMNADENRVSPMTGTNDWHQGKIKDLAVSDHNKIFMKTIAETMTKTSALQDNTKAIMTLAYLKEHYQAVVYPPKETRTGSDASVN